MLPFILLKLSLSSLRNEKVLFLDIQLVHSVTIGCNEHLIQVFPVRCDGVYTDVFQVFPEVCQLSAFRGINKQLIKQGIDDKFLVGL